MIVAAASVEETTGAWFLERHKSHAHVPWFMHLHNASATAVDGVELLLSVYVVIAVAHLYL